MVAHNGLTVSRPDLGTAAKIAKADAFAAKVGPTIRELRAQHLSMAAVANRRLRQRAAAMYSLIVTAKMNDVDLHAWLADVLARIATHPAHRIEELLPWHWKTLRQEALTAAAA